MSSPSTVAGAYVVPRPSSARRASDFVVLGTRRVLRVPMAAKVVGANVAVIACAIVVAILLHRAGASSSMLVTSFALALGVGTAINTTLTWVALRPIRDLRATADRIRRGDPSARIAQSAIADTDLRNIGDVVNGLLDEMDRDRATMHQLTGDIILAEDRERARISHELRESIAQSLAAVTYQLAALLGDSRDPSLIGRVTEIRLLTGQVLEQIDDLSHSVHPRVLSDLGLYAGLRRLATQLSTSTTRVQTQLSRGSESDLRRIGRDAEAGLYGIALIAAENALQHAHATRVSISVLVTADAIVLHLADDGRGFNVAEAEHRRPGMGLFKMRRRAAMIGARFEIESHPGWGTTIRVTIPSATVNLPSIEPNSQ